MTDSESKYIHGKINSVSGNEIVTICVGKAGTFMGNAFYSTIMNEHKIDKTGKFIADLNRNNNDQLLISKINTYFNHNMYNKYIPRVFFFDYDINPIDQIKSSPLGLLIDDNNFLSSSYNQCSVIWPKGHYIEGAEYIDPAMDKIRREIEICDYFQGINMIHSICGGWSGGFGTLLLVKLRDNYPDRQLFTYNIYPSMYTRSYLVNYNNHNMDFSIYNSILSIHQILENADLSFNIDNGVLLNICKNQCKLNNATYDDINWLISVILSGVTSTFRFHTEPTMDANLKIMSMHFTCFPRLKFMALAQSPFFPYTHYKYNRNVTQIINKSLDKDNMISPIRLEDGKILNYMFCYKSINDEIIISKINQYVECLQQKFCDDFVQWIPHNVQSCIVYDGNNQNYAKYTPLISTSIMNTTAIKGIYQKISAQFAKLYKRKSSIHWYKGEGMDELEFVESDKNIRDLITEYQDNQDRINGY